MSIEGKTDWGVAAPEWGPDLPARPRGWADRAAELERAVPGWWPWAALGVLLVVGGALIAYETRGTTFWGDEWIWILQRRGGGLATFLDPHNEHLSLVPIAIYKILFATVGLHHYWPYRAVGIAAHLGCVALVFVYARGRAGSYLALVAAALIVLFGPGWQEFMWPFQVAWLIAIGAGVGALLLLDRRDRAGDIGASVLLAVSLASAGPGLAVAFGLLVEVAQRRRWRDLLIVVIPIALYALWWVSYQQSHLSRNALTLLTRFVFDSAAGAMSSLTGLSGMNVATSGGDFLSWGVPLLLLGVLALAWRLRRLGAVPARVVTLLAMVIGFWLATGLGRAYVAVGPVAIAATGFESRYLYIGAILIVLLAVEAARGVRVRPGAGLAAGVLALAAIVSNLGPLRDAGNVLRGAAQLTRADLGTLDITRRIVSPGFRSGGFIFALLQAGPYFAAERALGTPADTPAQIAGEPDNIRGAADVQLIQIHDVTLQPVPAGAGLAAGAPPAVDAAQSGSVASTGGCVRYEPAPFTPAGASNALDLTLPSGALVVRASGGSTGVSLRRFSTQFQPIGTLVSGGSAVLRIGPDLAPEPWHVRLVPTGAVTACSVR